MTATEELRARRNELIARQREILDAADSEDRDLTSEEQQEFDRIETDVRGLDDRRERRQRLEESIAATPPDEQPQFGEVEERDLPPALRADEPLTVGRHALIRKLVENSPDRVPASLNEYRQALRGTPVQDTPSYRAAFFKAMVFGRNSLTPQEHRDMSVGVSGTGGMLVPTDFERQLIALLRDQVAIRRVARIITTGSGNPFVVPRVTGHGAAAWVDEEGSIPFDDEDLDQITFSAWKAATGIKVSWELLQDAFFDLEAYIRGEFALRIGYLQEAAYASGNGTKKPKGVLVDAQVGVNAAATGSVSTDELISLVYSVRRPFRVNGTFLLNDLAIAAIRKLKDSTGQYIWSPGLLGDEPDRILGYPVISDADIPAPAASAKSVAFGDFSYYWIRDVNGVMFQRLNEKFADTGQVGYLAWHRTDGHLVNTEAVKTVAQAAS